MDDFEFRDYQKPIVDAIENKGIRKALVLMPRRCLAHDTKIVMYNGKVKNISELKPGDRIISFDGEKPVIDTVKNVWDAGHKSTVPISASRFGSIRATRDHKFLTKNRSWVQAANLRDNDILYQYPGFKGHISCPEDAKMLGEEIYAPGFQQESIPEAVFDYDDESVISFIAGAIAVSGNIITREVVVDDNRCQEVFEIQVLLGENESLARDTYWLLRKVGIVSQSVSYIKNSWRIKIGRHLQIRRLASNRYISELIGDARLILNCKFKYAGKKFNPSSIKINLMRSRKVSTYDIETEKYHNFYANGYLVHNSGKDMVAFQVAIRQALKKVCTIYYIFPTFSQARKAIYDAVTIDGKKVLDFAPDTLCKKNSSEMKITFINGSIIQFLGSTEYDRLRGSNPYGIIYSEYAYQNPMAYITARPILAVNNGWALFISTPFGKNHFYDLYKVAKSSNDWFCYKLTVDDTRHLSEKELGKERAEMSNDMFMQEYYTSFDQGVSGSYYSKYLNDLKINNQISNVPWDQSNLVHTAWDLGYTDSTVIVFFQVIGSAVNVIDFYENSKEGLEHYLKFLDTKPYKYGKHIAPHDLANHSYSTGVSRIETARRLGVDFILAPKLSILDGIEAVRATLHRCYFDSVRCADLIKSLNSYRQEWNDKRQDYNPKPHHGKESHAADAFRMLCVTLRKVSSFSSPRDLDDRYQRVVYGEVDKFNPLSG